MATDPDKQRTISKPGEIEGTGLHSGKKVKVAFRSAEADTGVVFFRVDLPDKPAVVPLVENVSGIHRGTSLQCGSAEVRTAEHLLSAINGLGIDNLIVEMDEAEVPAMDGSSLEFFSFLKGLKVIEQDAPKRYLEVSEPVFYRDGGAFLTVIPDEKLSVAYTINYDHPYLKSQFGFFSSSVSDYEKQVAPARTFVLEEDIEKLRKEGLIKGGSLENALVITQNGIENQILRFPDECVAHKISDLLGDLMLLGQPLKGQVIAVRSGHKAHIGLVRELAKYRQLKYIRQAPNALPIFNVEQLMTMLPHRYPFLMVDKITHLEPNKLVVGVKNITFNEPQFTGHFPGSPIMPGVLITEAMAQCGGVLLLSATPNPQDFLVYFMSIDNVRFRRPVRPGDCLVLVAKALRIRSKVSHVHGDAYVGDEPVAEGDFMAMIVPRTDQEREIPKQE
jgi:UDP-3-O-[3-hydroxymyristoyl] N-acetylglucosamine deacetylase/3-hydroxyacyl-[acyl-carrier-protein] dehydratase